MALSAQYEEEDPLSVFLYALKAPETKRQYPRRLKVFLDFLKPDGTLEQQSKEFLEKAKQNPQWAQHSIIQFIDLQKERARKGEISYSTIANYYKATKLFVEMNRDRRNMRKYQYYQTFLESQSFLKQLLFCIDLILHAMCRNQSDDIHR